jgi:hypothetical protein
VQLTAADPWIPAERNLPLGESAWIRTGADSRVEIELDDGGAWRLGPDSRGGIADYARLSTGQRITLLSLERGLAYFSGESKARDSLALAAPGAQVTITKAVRIRLEAEEEWTRVSTLEGVARFSSPAAEFDLAQGQTTRVEPSNAARFFLYREVIPLDLDRWNAARDKALAAPVSSLHVAEHYGVADLDAAGQWIQTDDLGAVWKPKAAEGWAPFQNGHWRWYEGLGYTWVSGDAWGWLPYHYGRWSHSPALGWIWAPSSSGVFKPGEVFWMRGSNLAAWGPLAPGEEWSPPNIPRQFFDAYTWFAPFQPDSPSIGPAQEDARPKEPLKAAGFVAALPSPAIPASRLNAARPVINGATLRAVPVPEGISFSSAAPPPRPDPPRAPQTAPPAVIVTPPPEAPEQVPVPVPAPVYEGTFIVNPPGAMSSGAPQATAHPTTPKPPQLPAAVIPLPLAGMQHGGTKRPHDRGERELIAQVSRDFTAGNAAKTAQDLDEWTRRYPQSEFFDHRLADYAMVYNLLGQPERVLEYGAALMAKNIGTVLEPQAVVRILYLVMMNSAAIARPSREQTALGKAAAEALLEITPRFFEESRKPAEVTDAEWQKSRREIDTAARKTLKMLAARAAM